MYDIFEVSTVRIDEEIKARMDNKRKPEEEKRRNLAKAVLINEELKRPTRGEKSAEEIIRRFRDERR